MDHKESWVLKNWCFWTVVLEKTLESPLDCKEIKPVNPLGNQSWIFIGRTEAEAEAPVLWPPDAKNWLIGKDPGVGKDERQKEKVTTEDEMVRWHHHLCPTQWTWVWASSRSCWWTGEPGVLQSMGLQRVGHDWTNELNWTELMATSTYSYGSCLHSISFPLFCFQHTHDFDFIVCNYWYIWIYICHLLFVFYMDPEFSCFSFNVFC